MYATVNGLNYYDMHDAVLQSASLMSRQFTLVLDQVYIKAEHPANRDIVTKRTNDFRMVFDDVSSLSLYEEGYELFDADMMPYRKVEDRKVKDEDVSYDLEHMAGCEVDEALVEQLEDGIHFTLRLLVEDHTWRIEVNARGSHESFARFMSL